MLQRFIYILITLVLVIKIAGFFPLYKIKQWDIRENIEMMIEKHIFNEPLTQISISTVNVKNLKWEREGKEFWYEGKLYDIVRSEIQNEMTNYYCIQDTAETELSFELQESINKQSDTSNTDETSIIDFFKKVVKIYYPSNLNQVEDINWTIIPDKRLDFISFPSFYQSIYLQCLKPPPKSA